MKSNLVGVALASSLTLGSGAFADGKALHMDGLDKDITRRVYDVFSKGSTSFHDVNALSELSSRLDLKLRYMSEYDEDKAREMVGVIQDEINGFFGAPMLGYNDCSDRSLLFSFLGREYGLPVYLANVHSAVSGQQGHIFVRIDPDGKHNALNSDDLVNRGDFNWDTVSGKSISDKDYFLEYNVSANSVQNGIDLKNLNDFESLGFAYFDLSASFSEEGDKKEFGYIDKYRKALHFVDKALELGFISPEAYYQKARVSYILDYNGLSSDSVDKALELDSRNVKYRKLRDILDEE